MSPNFFDLLGCQACDIKYDLLNPAAFRSVKFLQVLIVVCPLNLGSQLDLRVNLSLDHLLGHVLRPNRVLEEFNIGSLSGNRGLEILERVEAEFLTHLLHRSDHFQVCTDSQLFTFLEKQASVDQIPQCSRLGLGSSSLKLCALELLGQLLARQRPLLLKLRS